MSHRTNETKSIAKTKQNVNRTQAVVHFRNVRVYIYYGILAYYDTNDFEKVYKLFRHELSVSLFFDEFFNENIQDTVLP